MRGRFALGRRFGTGYAAISSTYAEAKPMPVNNLQLVNFHTKEKVNVGKIYLDPMEGISHNKFRINKITVENSKKTQNKKVFLEVESHYAGKEIVTLKEFLMSLTSTSQEEWKQFLKEEQEKAKQEKK